MRVFYALELPDLLRNDIATYAQQVQKDLPGRYLDPSTYHVTLAFVGDIVPERLDDAKQVLYDALRVSRYTPLHLIPEELGVFTGLKKPTLRLALEQTEPLMESAQAVREALTEHGFTYNQKPFFPHITLARGVDLTDGFIPSPALPQSGRAPFVTLFESHLTDKGAIYEPLCRECLILPTA